MKQQVLGVCNERLFRNTFKFYESFMAITEIVVGCLILEIQSLFICSKLAEGTILRSATGVWGGGVENISHTHPPVV
jgi:hypothetical protein